MPERAGRQHAEAAKKAEQPAKKGPERAAEAAGPVTSSLYGDLMLAAHGGGAALAPEDRAWFGPRLGANLGAVRIHGGGDGAAVTQARGADAVTSGAHVFVSPGASAAGTLGGDRLLGHELAHAAQFARGGAATSGAATSGATGAATLEREAETAGTAAASGGRAAIRGGASAGAALARPKQDEPSDLAGWHPEQDSILLAAINGKVFLFPARGMVYVPDLAPMLPSVPEAPAAAQDLGAFLNLPSVGAGGTRIVSVGGSTAFLLDAGSDTRGVPALVFIPQLQAALAGMGVNDIQQIRLIHVHADHVNKIPDVMTQYPNADLVIPAAYLQGTVFGPLQKAIDAVRAVRGAAWSPTVASDAGDASTSWIRFQTNGYVFEQVALRSALANVARAPNPASYVCRATRTQDGATVMILGDFPLAKLPELHQAMERDRPGSADAFWAGVTTVVEHHASAMGSEADIQGFLELANRTLFKTGRLTIAVQTNLTNTTDKLRTSRQQTLELWQRVGIDVQLVDAPTANAPASSVTATRDTATTTGPDAAVPAPIPSSQTRGLARLQRLLAARQTLELWRPLIEARADDTKVVADLFTQFEADINTLRARLATAAESAARVRTSGPVLAGGARDYSAANTQGATYQASLTALETLTPVETDIGDAGFTKLAQLPQRSAAEIAAQAALEKDVRAGKYDDAFQKMIAQIDPATRESILYGPRGEALPKDVAFERLTAQYITASMLPSMDMDAPASASHLPPTGQGVARGAAIVLLISEGLDLYSQIKTSIALGKQTSLRKNVFPFIRRLAFWTELGARPAVVGVDDDWYQWSPDYERDYDKVMEHLNSWDALYIEDTGSRPCLSDQDYFNIAAHLAFYVRNYDEFATLFHDSAQDAVKWETPDQGGWPAATWYVRVAKYDTSWENEVEERWVYDEKLTKLMNAFAARIIANTDELMGLQAQGKELPGEDSRLGGFEADAPPAGAKRAHLRFPTKKTTVYTVGAGPAGWGTDGTPQDYKRLPNDVEWWSPPEFWVHETFDSGYTRVSGADYNTYALLRNLANEEYQLVAGNGYMVAQSKMRVANQGGTVLIPTWLLHVEP